VWGGIASSKKGRNLHLEGEECPLQQEVTLHSRVQGGTINITEAQGRLEGGNGADHGSLAEKIRVKKKAFRGGKAPAGPGQKKRRGVTPFGNGNGKEKLNAP